MMRKNNRLERRRPASDKRENEQTFANVASKTLNSYISTLRNYSAKIPRMKILPAHVAAFVLTAERFCLFWVRFAD